MERDWKLDEDDEPNSLEDAARGEAVALWADLEAAKRNAINTSWSIQCENVAYRIVTLARFLGAVPWQEVSVHLLLDGTYERVYRDASIPFAPIDHDRAREVLERIEGRAETGNWTGRRVDNPVTGRPLGWMRVDDGDDSP